MDFSEAAERISRKFSQKGTEVDPKKIEALSGAVFSADLAAAFRLCLAAPAQGDEERQGIQRAGPQRA
jgi:hypothetical protein